MDYLKLNIIGHVLIKDVNTGEVILNRRNAIHRENMSYAIASVLANSNDVNQNSGFVHQISFGNGGVVIDSGGNVLYNTPNVIDQTAGLYNTTYSKTISNNKMDNSENFIQTVHTGGNIFSDVMVTCTLDYNEPLGQMAYDDTSTLHGSFVFDEIGLVSQQGKLLTHLVFHPVQKSANRKIQVIYTLRISIG